MQISHADLASHITAASSSMFDLSKMDQYQTVGEAGAAMVDLEINRQAAMIGYLNDFRFMMLICFVAVPFVLFMNKPPPRKR